MSDKRGRLRLLLIAAVFAAPMVLAYVLYYSGWRPEEVRPHGELVAPARKIADIELKSMLDGAPGRITVSPPRWTFVYFGPSGCPSACDKALYTMRQIIAGQGREAHRLRSVMIVTDKGALNALRSRLKDYPAVLPLTGTDVEIARLASQFDTSTGGALAGQHRIYLVDPLGNFLMSYPADADPAGISKDLKRLLRYSQVG